MRTPAFAAARVFAVNAVVSLCRCKFAGGLGSLLVSLGGGDLLVESVRVGLLVADSVEVLAVQVGEGRAVARVAEEEVEYGPDEGEAAGLSGEAADDFGAPADLAE